MSHYKYPIFLLRNWQQQIIDDCEEWEIRNKTICKTRDKAEKGYDCYTCE